MFREQIRVELLEILQDVRQTVDNKVKGYKISGICAIVECHGRYNHRHEQAMRLMFKMWPGYSGNVIYPVPSPFPNVMPSQAYAHSRACRLLWEGQYGHFRRHLLDWMIDYLDGKIPAKTLDGTEPDIEQLEAWQAEQIAIAVQLMAAKQEGR